jgi:peptide/nickel transport system substrate-binding protein
VASQPRKWRRTYVAAALATAIAGTTAVAAAAHTESQNGKAAPSVAQTARADAHTLVIGVSSDPQTMDPEFGQATRANELIKNIYAQWVHYKTINTGQGYLRADVKTVVGDALSSWTARKDGTVVLNVRKGARFPDGTAVTADDLVYKIQRALGVNAGSVFDFNILGLTKLSQVKKTGPYTVTVKLPHASPILGPMLRDQDAGLVYSALIKKNATKSDPWGHNWLARTGGAATGAYVIAQNTPGTRLTLKANPNYWGPKPYFTTVILQVIPNSQTRSLLLKNGSIDIAEDLSLDDASRLQGANGVRLLSVPSIAQDVLGFVMDKKPFDDVRVRQAVAYAIPYDQLVSQVLRGQAKVAKGVWPRNSVWFQKNAVWPYKYDPAKAKELLQQAGYSGGLSFTVEINEGDADAAALAVPVQTALKAVGITMNISKLSAAQFQGDLGKRSMQAWIQSGLGSFVDDPYYQTFLWYGTKSVINWFKYSNATMDAALTRFATVLPPASKKALALKVQNQLNKDLPAISLGEPNYLIPIRSNIAGFLYEPDGLLTYRLLSRK